MRFLLLTTLATVLAFSALPSHGADLLYYAFNSNLDPETQDGVTGSGFLAGGGSDAEVGIGNNDGSYAFILITKNSSSVSNSVSNKQFAQFTVTPPAKNGMQIAQIQFIASRGGDSTPRNVTLRWSFDGYKANLGSANITSTWPDKKNYAFNVNAFAGGPVTFRLYASADEISNAAPSIRFSELVVTGNAIIYPPTVTPAKVEFSTRKTSVRFRGTAYSSVGITRVEVAKKNKNGTYSGANGSAKWNYTATSLKVGTNLFYVRSVDTLGQVSPPVKITVTRNSENAGPTPTPSNTP